MLSIGRLAAYAGTTVRAVRHYHAVGLLPEPERDRSGYRSYDAATVVQLVRIRTLAEAGVPLARVRELLVATPEEFGAAVADIDRRLRREIRERQSHRVRIAALAPGDALALPPEATAYVERLRGLGFSEAFVDGERDAWILVAARVPHAMPLYMEMKNQQLDDPRSLTLFRRFDESLERVDDEAFLASLADELVALAEQGSRVEAQDDVDFEEDMPEEVVELLDALMLDLLPAGPRLRTLIEERGWRGWSRMERVEG